MRIDPRVSDPRACIVESTPDAVVAIDHDGLVTLWNGGAERLYGIAAAEALGKPLTALYQYRWVSPEDERESRRALDDQGWWIGDNIHIRRDGSEVVVNSTVTQLPDERAVWRFAVVRDVTERRKLETSLADASRRKDEFLAMLSHELRNPLGAIASAVAVLQALGPSDPKLKASRDIIQRQVAHLTSLVDELLDASRFTFGKFTLQSERIAVDEAVRLGLETSNAAVHSRKQRLILSPSVPALHVNGDLNRLAQVVTNLVHNASKYSGEGGRIWVTLARDGGFAVLCVRDEGIGIAPENLPRVFDLFSQVHPSVAASEPGLGLGLTLVRAIVALHGGTVEVSSDGDGRGTEVRVRLPALLAAS